MDERVDNLAEVVAAVSEAAATSLDPTSILRRAMRALAPLLDVDRASLWRTTQAQPDLLAADLPDSQAPPATLAEELERPGASSHALYRQGHGWGHLVIVPATASALRPEQSAAARVAAVQISAALERAELFGEVMELERLKSDFIARVSHELRTPITIISGFVETLLAHGDELTGEQRTHMLERSQAAVSRLARLIEELLILSTLEGGVLSPDIAPVGLEAVFGEVAGTAVEPGQVVTTPGPWVTVATDRNLLARALSLVVDNAIKYGGTAELSARVDGSRVVIEVRDRGAGLAADVRSTAFEMFTRSQTVSTVPGLGVGLAIARTIVEVLEGTIEIGDTADGPGAVVTIRIPA